MGNSHFSVPPDANDVLVECFQLDADAAYLSLPICCPGKQAMFHVPRNLLTFVQEWNEKKGNGVYISLGEGGTVSGV